jgi:hypothetical protein
MKKRLLQMCLCLGILTAALCVSALAATPGYCTGSVNYVEAGTGTAAHFTVNITNSILKSKQCVLLVVPGDGSTINPDSIEYIDQAAASDTGAVSFSFIPRTYVAGQTTEDCTVLMTYTGGSTPLQVGTLSKTAVGSTVTGSVAYLGTKTGPTVTLTSSAGTVYTATVGTSVSNTASYTITGVPDGDYTLSIAKKSHLPYAKTVTVSGNTALNSVAMLAGDVDTNHSYINASDLSKLLTDFKKTSAVDNATNINEDGYVNATDLSALLTNFKKNY